MYLIIWCIYSECWKVMEYLLYCLAYHMCSTVPIVLLGYKCSCVQEFDLFTVNIFHFAQSMKQHYRLLKVTLYIHLVLYPNSIMVFLCWSCVFWESQVMVTTLAYTKNLGFMNNKLNLFFLFFSSFFNGIVIISRSSCWYLDMDIL